MNSEPMEELDPLFLEALTEHLHGLPDLQLRTERHQSWMTAEQIARWWSDAHGVYYQVEKTGAIEGMGRPVGSWSAEDWNKYCDGKYGSNRRLFLVHSLAPSRRPGQKSDVFIYLRRHKSDDLSDVVAAEFFLGPYWRNQVFTVPNTGGPIGITTSAYGEFLCVCRVQFTDGEKIFLDRYIDFAVYDLEEPDFSEG
jgi:hypothetical protein